MTVIFKCLFFQADQCHGRIEKNRKYHRDLFDFDDYCEWTETAAKHSKLIRMEPWDFLQFPQGQSADKTKKQKAPLLSLFKQIQFRKGEKVCFIYMYLFPCLKF